MAHLEHGTSTLQNPVTAHQQIQTLQVFNSGKPCGWLGQTASGFWFHYSSNTPQQHWVSLLMPPSNNFYQQAELFPVFAQYGSSLAELHQCNGTQLGTLSFANPDNPVVKQPLRTPPPLLPGQSSLIARQHGSQLRRNFADTVVHHECTWALVLQLRAIKHQADPNNRLPALRWTLQAQLLNGHVQHPRPDMDVYQQLLGFEPLTSVLNLNERQYEAITQQTNKLALVLAEVARTYCKNAASEIELIHRLLPLLHTGSIRPHLVYSHRDQREKADRPTIIGFEYLRANC